MHFRNRSLATLLALLVSNTAFSTTHETCTTDINYLKNQVKLLDTSVKNLSGFMVSGKDKAQLATINELKTKVEALTLNYDSLLKKVLEQKSAEYNFNELKNKVDSLKLSNEQLEKKVTKLSNQNKSNPCDEYTKMPGVIELTFSNNNLGKKSILNHSIPINSSAYRVCFYDDLAFWGDNFPSKVYISLKIVDNQHLSKIFNIDGKYESYKKSLIPLHIKDYIMFENFKFKPDSYYQTDYEKKILHEMKNYFAVRIDGSLSHEKKKEKEIKFGQSLDAKRNTREYFDDIFFDEKNRFTTSLINKSSNLEFQIEMDKNSSVFNLYLVPLEY
nr:hypothetical protein GTC16762_26590 [Pigmentibacter ruber]